MTVAWQSMDTAPKDGTKIDLLYPWPRGRVVDAFWMGDLGIGWATRVPIWENGMAMPEERWNISTFPNMQPTHWMPAPTLPPESLPEIPEGAEVIVVCPCGAEWTPAKNDRCPECNYSPDYGAN